MKKGFTLLEILLVIAAIGILAAIVIVAINPTRQLAQVRNVERESEINAIFSAIQQYAIDNSEYPPGLENYYQDICSTTVTTNCIDLSVLTPTYLASIPEDPQGAVYDVALHPDNGRLSVVAFGSELTDGVKHINGFGLIESWEDLYNVRNELSQTYNLATDLNATTPGYDVYASALANGGLGWDPIGDSSNPFTGRFDGHGREIRDLVIQRPTQDYVGLFGYLEGSTISNLVLQSFSIEGRSTIATLAGISGDPNLVERIIVRSSIVQGSGNNVGGIVAASYGSSIVREVHFFNGSVTLSAGNSVGSILGINFGILERALSRGSIVRSLVNNAQTGGLVGISIIGVIRDSYNFSEVYGWNQIGGITGDNRAVIERSYSAGLVAGPNWSSGGITGSSSGTISDSYWNLDTVGQTSSPGGGTGLTTSQMQQQSSYTGWDFGTVWSIDGSTNDGYPFLQWEN